MDSKQITKICIFIFLTVIISVSIIVVGKMITDITIANINSESKIEVLNKEKEIEKTRQSNIDSAYNKAVSKRDSLWNANADDEGKVNNNIRDWVYESYYKELDFIAKRYSK